MTASSGDNQPVAVDIGQATVTDLFTVTTTNDAPAGGFPVGVTTVTYSATDAAGNIGTATQTVTVTDTTAPTVTAPPAITLEATGATTPITLGTATAADVVDGVLIPTNDAPAGGFPLGTTTVTWTATDAAGNVGTATQTVTITDTTPPAITVPADVTATSPDNQPVAANIGNATATDIFSVTVTNDAPATFPVGATTVTWTAADANGNTATATQLVTVNYAPPVATEVIYWHHNDHLGTPQALTDVNGTVVWTASYTPFGIATVDEDPDGDGFTVTNNFRFPGQYFDAETNLNYNRYRTYDPRTQYTQHDPIGLHGGLNPFSYASQNPINAFDSLGLKVEWGNYVLKNPRVVSNIEKLNRAVIATGKDDECFTIRITGGDSYVDNNGVVRSSTNHMPVIDSNGRSRSTTSAHNDHKGNRAVDISIDGDLSNTEFLNLVEPNSEFVLNPNLKYKDSHIHLRIPR